MLNINEEDLKAAIVAKAADEIVSHDDDLSGLIELEVKKRVNAIFVDRAEAQIQVAIDAAVANSFDAEYQRVTAWGQPDGPVTTIRKQLEKTVSGYWSAKVDAKTGKPSSSDYSSVTRAEFLMTQICAEDFSAAMRQSALNVTGALKDGLRNQIAMQMDSLLNELFRIKSLQDQGKVEKPY
ncbi:prophage PSSB64-02 [Xanthomonas sp. NCPPB 1128]|uniref:hypothetical protein n=1 Tax=Xanthomonas sp. NCPPB 1128 TaxID=1775876 RepID=UPI00065A9C30|nr:hypothetical protein [Xanthomonas sp. NCPPB 1128]KMM77053.1 prophage PSSB64-02 [Xanthomonas sp. NCPPB 1128]KMM77097.1 prophage PSSB64-02 [Xanthomonas sp. NCPPB 1128]